MVSTRYYVSRLRNGLSRPREGVGYLYNLAVGRAKIRLSGAYQKPASQSVLYDDWDTLVILDACRFDVFEAVNPFDAPLESRISQASNTGPWFSKNFINVQPELTSDVVYVTANPKASSERVDSDRFYHLEETFRTHWDEEAGTVRPEDVVDVAIQLHARYPDKRLVVHLLQPHGPFVGTDTPNLHAGSYESLQRGEVSRETVLAAYRECLEYALDEVQRLTEYLSGTVVVTADHGECFGEAGIYAHPPWAHHETLLTVPWVEVEGEGREPPAATDETGSEVSESVNEQLRRLGYR